MPRTVIPVLPLLTERVIKRFRSRVGQRGVDECWPWMARRMPKTGYGVMSIEPSGSGKSLNLLAHRIAKTLALGRDVTPVLRHQCHNPPCCNPAHLLEGTHADNWADSVKAGRVDEAALGRVNRGKIGTQASAARYDDAQRAEAIRLWRDERMSKRDVASRLGCHRETINRWLYDSFPQAFRMPSSIRRMRREA